MKKLISIIFILFLTINLFSQHYSKYTNHWYFLNNAGLDFSNYSPIADPNGAIAYSGFQLQKHSASMSDYFGNLLFYTDGYHVFSQFHDTMPNGYGLKGGIVGVSSIIIGEEQNVILPMPKNPSKYYYFLASGFNFIEDSIAYYSIIDMAADSGRGDVIAKNIPFMNSSSTKAGVVKHANGECYWLILHKRNSNAFYAYPFCGTNDSIVPVISNVGQIYTNIQRSMGEIIISPDGQKIAVNSHAYNGMIDSVNLELFDFNANTGVISNPMIIQRGIYDDYFYIAFSSDSKKLYVANRGAGNPVIYQFNLSLSSDSAINASKTFIQYAIPNSIFGRMQLGLNGKIYISHFTNYIPDSYLGVINNPNTLGTGCNYVDNGIYLGSGHQGSSLPHFVSSYLLPPMNYSYSNTCLGDTVSFVLSDSVSTVLWDFGDTVSMNNASTLYEPTHFYASPGTYTVKAACLHYGMHDTVVQIINIYPLPILDLGQDTLIDSNTVLALDAGAGFTSYLWSNGATTSSISINGASLGIGVSAFSVEVIDSNGCSAKDSIKVYKNSTSPGFEEVSKKSSILIYPNPTDNTLNVIIKDHFQSAKLELYSLQGQLLIQKQITQKEFDLDVSALSEGIYQLRIILDNKIDTRAVEIIR